MGEVERHEFALVVTETGTGGGCSVCVESGKRVH